MLSVKSPKKQSLEDQLEIFKAYRDYVEHEDGLVNNRITWMLTIHGFLYASYGLTLHKKLEIAEKLNSCTTQGRFVPIVYSAAASAPCELSRGLVTATYQIEFFLILIAFVGLVISRSARRSIKAAGNALDSIKRIFTQSGLIVEESKDVDNRPSKWRFWRWENRSTKTFTVKSNEFRLPSITGGGLIMAVKPGFSASLRIPEALLVSWVFALISQLLYIVTNYWT